MGRITVVRAIPDGIFLNGAPSIWPKGRTREGAVAFHGASFEGYVYVDLIHARTGFIKRHLEFKNLIVDAGLHGIGNGIQLSLFLVSGYIGVGTGNAAPTNADVGLQTPTGVRTNSIGGGTITSGAGAANAYWYVRVVREFSEAQSNGNLAEFGVFNASSAGTMLARQLFKDVGGTPTVITKTSDDKLRITYEFRMYPPTVDSTGTVNISGTNYDFVGRACAISNPVSWGYNSNTTGMINQMGHRGFFTANALNSDTIGSTLSNGPSGATLGAFSDTSVVSAYGGAFMDENVCVWQPGTANFTGTVPGVRGFIFQPWGSSNSITHQMQLSTHIPKVNTQRLTLAFRISWGRH